MSIAQLKYAVGVSLLFASTLLLTACQDGGATNNNISLDTAQYAVNQGSTTQITVTNTSANIVTGVSVADLPSGVSASTCASIAVGQTCVITLTAAKSITPATTIIKVGGNNTNTVSASLTVKLGIPLQGPAGAVVNAMIATATTLYSATTGGVYQQTLGQSTWVPINVGLVDQNMVDIVQDNHNGIYAANAFEVFKFNGTSWNAYTTSGLPSDVNIQNIAVDGSGNIFAVVESNNDYYVYELPVGSLNWQNISGSLGEALPEYIAANGSTIAVLTNTKSDGSSIYAIYQWTGSAFNSIFSNTYQMVNLTITNAGTIYAGALEGDGGHILSIQNSDVTDTYTNSPFEIWDVVPDNQGGFYCVGYDSILSQPYRILHYDTNDGVVSHNPAFNGYSVAGFNPSALVLVNQTLYSGISSGVVAGDVSNPANPVWTTDNQGFVSAATTTLLENSGLYGGVNAISLAGTTPGLTYLNTANQWNLLSGSGLGISAQTLQLASLNGTNYLATDRAVYAYDGTAWSNVSDESPYSAAYPGNVLVADASNLYELESNNDVYAYTGQPGSQFELIAGVPDNSAISQIFTRVNNAVLQGFYANCYDNASTPLCEWTGSAWNTPAQANLYDGSIVAVSSSSNGTYVAYEPDSLETLHVCELNSSNCNDIASPSLGEQSGSDEITLYQSANGTLYMGVAYDFPNYNGLYYYNGSTWVNLMSDIDVLSLTEDANNNLYVGTAGGNYEIPANH